MPNANPPAAASEVRAQRLAPIASKLDEALSAGRGVVVLTMKDLVPAPDVDHLYGDPVAARPVHADVWFVLGYVNADSVGALGLWPEDLVVVVDYEHPRAELLRAARDFQATSAQSAADRLAASLRKGYRGKKR